MAETPLGTLPDYFVQVMPDVPEDHSTEVLMGGAGGEQRRAQFRLAGYRRIVAVSTALTQAERFALRTFLSAKRGRFASFYAWSPNARQLEDFPCGTAAAVSKIIAPIRITGAIGGGVPLAATVGSIGDIRVGGQTKAFSRLPLLPRPGTFASLRLNLTATNQSIGCGVNASLRPAGNFSVAAWIWFAGSVDGAIVSNQTANTSGFSLSVVQSTSKIRLRTNQAGANTQATSTGTISAATWVHVAVVVSGTTATFYINGAAAGTGTVTAPVTATAAFAIGVDDLANAFNGMVNDVRFYDTNISAGEVANIYAGNATATANLRGWWRITEGLGAAAADLSGNNNSGTLNNSPVWAAGEEEITFTGGAQTGAVTAWGICRERLIVRYDSDSIGEGFWRESPGAPLAVVNLPLKEVG